MDSLRAKLAKVTRQRDQLQGYVYAAESSAPDRGLTTVPESGKKLS